MCVTSPLQGNIQLKGAKNERSSLGLSNVELMGLGQQYMPGQARNQTYVSRLQCVQAAVEAQIERAAKESPNKKVGLIIFGNDVTIVGDGMQEQETVAGDKLRSWDNLVQAGERFKLTQPIKDAKDALIKCLWELEPSGQTALGPALHLGVSIAGHAPASQVVLCTDGLANLGLGSLEGDKEQFSMFYTEVAERAKLGGLSVNVITLKGTDCSVESLAVVTSQTSGQITRVDALQLTKEFGSVLANPILATGCFAKVLLHNGLQFRGELDDEDDATRNWLVRDIGNVTATTEASFSYGFRPKDVSDLSNRSSVPFQLQVTYDRPDGGKYLRCVTETISLTGKREEAEQNADARVIGSHAAQRAARYAAEGNYERAQMEARSANRFMLRSKQVGKVNDGELTAWQSNVETMDKVIRNLRQTEQKSESDVRYIPDGCGLNQGAAIGEAKAKSRKMNRKNADSASVTIHQQQAVSSKKLWGLW